jgi:hypothetical protein
MGDDDMATLAKQSADRQERILWLTEALLEFITIAGLFALLFALFVLCGAVQEMPL